MKDIAHMRRQDVSIDGCSMDGKKKFDEVRI
jgi:hypothetical protein